MSKTPVTLLERLRQADTGDAWDRFVDLYSPLLFFWARRAGLQSADCADLVQEVFLVLSQALPTFHYDPNRSFRSWLRALTVNKWRQLCRRPALPVQAGVDPDELPDPADDFWETEYRQQLAVRALRLMQSEFQPATWQACWETVVNERPAAAVAAELGLSAAAVRTAKCRVLARLRQELASMME